MKEILMIFLFLVSIPPAIAWDDCPSGEINCTYPGECGKYTDTNNNKICDHSEINPKTTIIEKQQAKISSKYNFIPLSVALIMIYLLSYFLSMRNMLSYVSHKKIWNFFLLMSFLAAGITGILLVLMINYSWTISLPFNLLYWHVETGIAMSIVSIFHIFWHFNYFKSYLRTKSA